MVIQLFGNSLVLVQILITIGILLRLFQIPLRNFNISGSGIIILLVDAPVDIVQLLPLSSHGFLP